MNDNSVNSNPKKRGRPALPASDKKILFAKRLSPNQILVVQKALQEQATPSVPEPIAGNSGAKEIQSLREQNMALAEELQEAQMEIQRGRDEYNELLAGSTDMLVKRLSYENAELRAVIKKLEETYCS